jgi:hypothetical protein
MNIQTLKQMVAVIAASLTFVSYIPYYRDILRGKTHPHLYTWLLWALLSALLVVLQIKGGAGAAVLVSGAAVVLCIGVVILSIKKGTKDITRLDKYVAVMGLVAIFFWLVIDQPVLSALLLIVADLLAFIPTIRKSWKSPHSETLSLYVTNTLRFSMALFSVREYTFLSASWIVVWVLANGLFALMLILRRRQISL